MANNKHNQLKRQYSLDGGLTWQDLSPMVYKVGNITETNSSCTDKDGCRWRILPLTVDFDCDSNYNMYQVEIEECLNDEGVFVPSGERRRYQLIETYSTACGYTGPFCTPSTRDEYSYTIEYNGGAVEYNQYATPVVKQIKTTIETDKGCKEIKTTKTKQIEDYSITYSPDDYNYTEEERTVTATVSYSGSVIGSFDYIQKNNENYGGEPVSIGDIQFKGYKTDNLNNYTITKIETNNGINMIYSDYISIITEYEDLNLYDGGNLNSNINNLKDCFSRVTPLITELISFPDTSNIINMSGMFYGCQYITKLNLSNFNTSNVTDFGGMFRQCFGLEELVLSGWDLSNVTTIGNMFYDCENLRVLDLSGWEISSNIGYIGSFYDCNKLQTIIMNGSSCESINRLKAILTLEGINVNSINFITDSYCDVECSDESNCENTVIVVGNELHVPNLKLNGIGYNLAKDIPILDRYNRVYSVDITTLDGAYPLTNCYETLVSDAYDYTKVLCFPDTSNVTNMSRMFCNYDASYLGEFNTACTCINCKGWNTSNVTNMSMMFFLKVKLDTIYGIEDWDVSNVTDMGAMFYGCKSLTSLDLSKWDMSKVTTQTDGTDKGMFENLYNLKELHLPQNINNITNYTHMFQECRSLTTLDARNINTPKATSLYCMFEGCDNLHTIYGIENWDVSNVTNMRAVFNSCDSLTSLDVSNWDVSNVTDMGAMFSSCKSLTSLDLSNWEFNSDAVGMVEMFKDCTNLTSLDLSGWKLQHSTTDSMFKNCTNLTNIIGIEDWDFSISSMDSMFAGCTSLTSLDLSNLKITPFLYARYTFSDCTNLRTLNLSGWALNQDSKINYTMFNNCDNLTTIYCYGCDQITIDILNSIKPTNCTLVY